MVEINKCEKCGRDFYMVEQIYHYDNEIICSNCYAFLLDKPILKKVSRYELLDFN